jgi:hypothetical protein
MVQVGSISGQTVVFPDLLYYLYERRLLRQVRL